MNNIWKIIVEKIKNTSELTQNIFTLMTGTTIAQLIPVIISVVLTRLYSPEDFGILALYMSIVAVLGNFANGYYEYAIMHPKKEENAINILALAFIINLMITSILITTVLLFHSFILKLIGNSNLFLWIYFIPLSGFLAGLFNLFNNYYNRKKDYKFLAKINIIKSLIYSITQLLLGFFHAGFHGLILGYLFSQILPNLFFLKNLEIKKLKKNIYKNKIIALAKRYQDFPKYTSLSSILNVISRQIPIFFLNSFFNTAIVGFYSLSNRVLTLPLSFIGKAISQVYYQHSANNKEDIEKLKITTWNLYQRLFFIGIIPFSILTAFGDKIFYFVFGAEWIIAGQYAQLLSIWLFLVFLISPLSTLLLAIERQKDTAIFNIVLFFARVISFLIGGLIIKNAFWTITLFSAVSSIIWLIWGTYMLSLIKIKIKNKLIFDLQYGLPIILFFLFLRKITLG